MTDIRENTIPELADMDIKDGKLVIFVLHYSAPHPLLQ